MSDNLLNRLQRLADAHLALTRSEHLFRRDDRVKQLYLIQTGEVCLCRDTSQGSALVLHHARSGSVLAEGSVWSERYHCNAVATIDTRLQSIPMTRVRQALRSDAALANAWAALLAGELQQSRARSEILRLRGVAARLAAWQALTGSDLPPHGEQRRVADEIGVTPEALYRELARRRAAGKTLDGGTDEHR